MEYNSKREELLIPEYGRHIQGMIRYARALPDRNERQAYIERIVGLMMQMHPQNRNLEDYREKMWKHVFHIAEYKLDVTLPNGIVPTPEGSRKKPEKVPYPSKDTRFRHYGHNVQKLIARAIEMESGVKKDGFVQVIGSYMKLAYKTWNREHYVSDDIIIEDLRNLSGGKLEMIQDASLDNLTRFNNNNNNRRMMDSGGRQGGGGDRDRRRSSNSGGKMSSHGRDRDRDRDGRGNNKQQQRSSNSNSGVVRRRKK